MLVQRTPLPPAERRAFEATILASGRDPAGFRAEMFEAANDAGPPMRRVHVACDHASAQYDASGGPAWTESFARHLARGCFG